MVAVTLSTYVLQASCGCWREGQGRAPGTDSSAVATTSSTKPTSASGSFNSSSSSRARTTHTVTAAATGRTSRAPRAPHGSQRLPRCPRAARTPKWPSKPGPLRPKLPRPWLASLAGEQLLRRQQPQQQERYVAAGLATGLHVSERHGAVGHQPRVWAKPPAQGVGSATAAAAAAAAWRAAGGGGWDTPLGAVPRGVAVKGEQQLMSCLCSMGRGACRWCRGGVRWGSATAAAGRSLEGARGL